MPDPSACTRHAGFCRGAFAPGTSPSRANEPVCPWYVLHQTALIVMGVAVSPWRLGPVLEPAALLAGTVGLCWGLTALVRRVRWLRPLFGLPPKAQRKGRQGPSDEAAAAVH